MTEADKISYAMRYLRRKYTLAELRTMADTVFTAATDTVTLTMNGYEGGSASGMVTFEKAIIGSAIENLIEELDDTVRGATPAPVRYVNIGGGRLEV